MNIIKFSDIDDLKKETNNVEVYDILDLKVDDKIYKYYSNAQISIYVTKKCNGSCYFCMNNYQKRFLDCKNISENDYFYHLDKVLNIFKDRKIPFTITGGEATKDEKLVPILRKLRESGFKSRTFATNGTGLFDYYENKPIIVHLKDNDIINNINISRMVVDDNLNKKIMGINQSNQDINRIFTFGNINNMDMRLSCILQKCGVKNLNDILDFVNFYDNMNINTVMFRELIDLNNMCKKYKEQKIDINKIFEEINNNKDFKYIRTLEGMYYTVKVYKYKNKIVKCYKEKKKNNSDIIKEFVFYPDGSLDSGFNNKTILKAKEVIK